MTKNRPWLPLCFAFCAGMIAPAQAWASSGPPPAGFSASSTVLRTTVSGQREGSFLDPVLGHEQARSVGFSVVGLPESTLTHWHYVFSGSIAATGDNAALQLQASFAWDLIDAYLILQTTDWGVAWVDGPPEFGDFAGNLTNPPSLSGCCYTLPTTWSPGTFSGAGSIGFVTDIPLTTGIVGSYRHAVVMGLSGSIQSTLTVSLVAITADLPLSDVMGAQAPYLLLDDGSRFAISSSVPEPHAGLLALGGAIALGWLRRRRSA